MLVRLGCDASELRSMFPPIGSGHRVVPALTIGGVLRAISADNRWPSGYRTLTSCPGSVHQDDHQRPGKDSIPPGRYVVVAIFRAEDN